MLFVFSFRYADAMSAITHAAAPAQGGEIATAEAKAEAERDLEQAREALHMLLPTSGVDPHCASLPLRAHYFLEAVAGAAWGLSARVAENSQQGQPQDLYTDDLKFRRNFVRVGGATELARLLQDSLGAATQAAAAVAVAPSAAPASTVGAQLQQQAQQQAGRIGQMAAEDVDTLRGCFVAGIAIARNLIAPHVDEYGAYGNREGDPNRGFDAPIPQPVLLEELREAVSQSTKENVAQMEPGVDFWQRLSYRVACCAAAGRADLIGTAMQTGCERKNAHVVAAPFDTKNDFLGYHFTKTGSGQT